MTKKRLDREYFQWLTSQIGIREDNPSSYDGLFQRMHETEFLWIVSRDDNRVADGLEIRKEFLDSAIHRIQKMSVLESFMETGVSVLEVLIALSRRVRFLAGGDTLFWTWQLIENLGLNHASDPLTNSKSEKVDEILDTLIWRTYSYDGRGGFFPLNEPREDQTKIEIWNQMNAYVNEIVEP
jgi:hypothetical protein